MAAASSSSAAASSAAPKVHVKRASKRVPLESIPWPEACDSRMTPARFRHLRALEIAGEGAELLKAWADPLREWRLDRLVEEGGSFSLYCSARIGDLCYGLFDHEEFNELCQSESSRTAAWHEFRTLASSLFDKVMFTSDDLRYCEISEHFGTSSPVYLLSTSIGKIDRDIQRLMNATTSVEELYGDYDKNPRVHRWQARVALGLKSFYASKVWGVVSGQLYLVSQAPSARDIAKSWGALWEERVCHIICLRESFEGSYTGETRDYWPAVGASKTYGEIEVTTEKESEIFIPNTLRPGHSIITSRSLRAKKGEEEREITQFHLRCLFDGTTPDPAAICKLIEMVGELKLTPLQPLSVHCWGGIGRAGTFVLANECSYVKEASKAFIAKTWLQLFHSRSMIYRRNQLEFVNALYTSSPFPVETSYPDKPITYIRGVHYESLFVGAQDPGKLCYQLCTLEEFELHQILKALIQRRLSVAGLEEAWDKLEMDEATRKWGLRQLIYSNQRERLLKAVPLSPEEVQQRVRAHSASSAHLAP